MICYYKVRTMYLKRKDSKSPHYIPQKENTPPNKNISYTNSSPKNMTTLIAKTTSPFCHE